AFGERAGIFERAVLVGEREQWPADGWRFGFGVEQHDGYVFFAFRPGSGKQMKKNGSQRKMKSKSVTMMINRISAHSGMIGIEREQIIPRLSPLPVLQGAPSESRLGRSLWNGHGSTESTRSPSVNPRIRPIWPHSVSEMRNAVFLSNLRRPPGVVSIGRPMRMGRAGASGSKKPAIWNGS